MEKYATHNAPVKQVSCTIAALLLLIVISPLWAGGEETANSNTQTSHSPNAVRIGPKYTLTRGNQFDLCRNYVDLINRVEESPIDDQARMVFPFDKLARQQGFAEIHWREELDKNQYKELLRHYYSFTTGNHIILRSDFYSLSTEEQKKLLPDEELKAKLLSYYNNNFNHYFTDIHHLWRTQMDMNFDGKMDTVYRIAHCRDNELEEYGNRCDNAIFLYDPSQPYEQFFTTITAKVNLRGHQFYYKGRPYNYNGDVGELYGGANLFWEKSICEIMSTKSWKEVQRHNEQLRQQQARKAALKQQTRQKALKSQGHDHD